MEYIKVKLCDICGKRPATYHQKMILNGARYEVHLCEKCLNDRRYGALSDDYTQPKAKVCPTCGATFDDIADSAYLGCSDCYKVFRAETLEKIYAMHQTRKHTGKRLARRRGDKKVGLSDRESMTEQLFLAREEGRYSDEEELYNDYLRGNDDESDR